MGVIIAPVVGSACCPACIVFVPNFISKFLLLYTFTKVLKENVMAIYSLIKY